MSYNFPNSPAYGDTFERYKWDGEKWCLTTGGRPKAPSTPPSILTGIVGWWDASIFASMSLTGANVASIADQSASAKTLFKQGNSFPTYNATGFNTTKPAITTVASGQASLLAAGFPMGTGNTMTLWYCGTLLQATNGSYTDARLFSYRVSGLEDWDSAGEFLVCSHANSLTTLQMTRNSIDTTSNTATASPAGHRVIITVSSSGVVTIWIDGVASTTNTSAGNWISGGDICIGCQASAATQYGSWTFGEAGIATGFADATAVAALDTYLKDKWGLNPATNFLARTSGLDATHIAAYTALINGLEADGVWAKLDVLHIYATQNTTTAQLNLVSASYPATLNGSPSFTADLGYLGVSGSSTVYIDTGFNPRTATTPKATQNSMHISAWSALPVSDTNSVMGAIDSGSAEIVAFKPRDAGNFVAFNNNVTTISVAEATGAGHFISNRSTSSAVQGYKNGSSIVTSSSNNSINTVNANIYVLGINNIGTAVGRPDRVSGISIGSSLTSGEATAFYNRLRTYMTAVGVP